LSGFGPRGRTINPGQSRALSIRQGFCQSRRSTLYRMEERLGAAESGSGDAGYRRRLSLSLGVAREAASVRLVRRVMGAALTAAGVAPEPAADILLATGEACGNVVAHAAPAAGYTVNLLILARVCTVEVIDAGPGLPPDALDRPPALATDESGRGLHVIRMVTDDLTVRSSPGVTVLCFAKKLEPSPVCMSL
jgi:serine/threonine-protein kinase RsbW